MSVWINSNFTWELKWFIDYIKNVISKVRCELQPAGNIAVCSFHLPAFPTVVGMATRYGLDGPGIESRCGRQIFRTHPDRPWDLTKLVCSSYWLSFPVIKRPGVGVDHPPPSNTEVKEGVELRLCSPSEHSWPVIGRSFTFTEELRNITLVQCHICSSVVLKLCCENPLGTYGALRSTLSIYHNFNFHLPGPST
jgi:hypothetical protein